MPDLKHTLDGYRKELQSVIHQPLLNLGNTCWLASSLRCLRWAILAHLMPEAQCAPLSMLRRPCHVWGPVDPLASRHWDQQDVAECWSHLYADRIPPRLCGRLIHLRKTTENMHCEVVLTQQATLQMLHPVARVRPIPRMFREPLRPC